jgi:hypothetical protein
VLGILFPDQQFVSIGLICLGVVTVAITVRHKLLAKGLATNTLLFFALCMGTWLGASVWSQGSLSPFTWEKMLNGTVHPETLFHTTITNMVRYYHVPSTGLDGLPKLHYHYGSHIIFATLASALNSDTITFYELGYPVIFLPLLSVGLCNLALQLRKVLGSKQSTPLSKNWLFWSIFTGFFIGFIPENILYKVGMPPLLFFSESYGVAMALTFLTISVVVGLLTSKVLVTGRRLALTVFSVLFLPLSIGLVKISHLYLLLPVWWYYLIRTKNKDVVLYVTSVILVIGSWLVYQEGMLSDHSGGVFPYYYITQVITLRWFPMWLVVGLGADWLYGIFVFVRNKLERKTYFDLELVIYLAITGVLPVLLLDLGPNGNYFVDGFRWLVFVLFLSQTETIAKLSKVAWSKLSNTFLRTILFIASALIIASIINNLLSPFEKIIILKQQVDLTSVDSKRAEVLNQLLSLGKAKHLSHTALYISNTSPFWNNQPRCSDAIFIATSLAGYPLLEGAPDSKCAFDKYAYSLYPKKPKELSPDNDLKICNYATGKGFTRIVVFAEKTRTIQCE